MSSKNKNTKLYYISLIIFFLITIAYSSKTFSLSDISFISMKVNPLHVTIGSSGDISLPEVPPSFDTGEIQATFSTNSFWLDDRKASNSGYITTIQSSNLTFGNNIIPGSNIYFKTSTGPTVIYGLANPLVTFGTSIKNTRGSIGLPVVYFKRDAGANGGLIGRYGDSPSIKIIIPPAQAPGTYVGTLYFTLISG